MVRDKSLIPLSRQHQHALALCVRIDRAAKAGKLALESWNAEVAGMFEQEITHHFAAEEEELFPACTRVPQLRELVSELLQEHAELRRYFAQAADGQLGQEELMAFGEKLSAHIRKEERQLFEDVQKLMSEGDLAKLRVTLARSLDNAPSACSIRGEPTPPSPNNSGS